MLADLTVHCNPGNSICLCIQHLDCSCSVLTYDYCIIMAGLLDCKNNCSLTHQTCIRLTADCKAVTILRSGWNRDPVCTVSDFIRHGGNDIHMDICLPFLNLKIFGDSTKTRALKDLPVRPFFT